MTVLECPLCCAENFPDEASLREHLLNLSENIVCPLCEVQFKTIRCLGLHLGGECARISSETGESAAIEQSDSVSNMDDLIVSIKSEEETEQEMESNLPVTEVITADVDQVTSSHDDFAEVEKQDCSGQSKNSAETTNHVEFDKGSDGVAVVQTNLFSCSGCDITFTSVEDHLKEFHRNEQVIVDSADVQGYHVVERMEDLPVADSDKMDTGEIPPSSTGENYSNIGEEILSDSSTGIIWTQEDIKTLMLENWTVEDPLNGGGQQTNCWGSRVSNSQRGYVLMPRVDGAGSDEEGRWVQTRHGFFYAPTEERAAELKLRDSSEDTQSAIDTIEVDWPPEIRHLPVATFVLPALGPDYYPGYLVEKKPYIYRDHKVRVVLVKGGEGGIPGLDEVPFSDPPPSGVMWPPLLEPVAGDAPPDLAGSFAVLWPCRLCSQLDLDPCRDHLCLAATDFSDRRTEKGAADQPKVVARGKMECGVCSAKVQSATHLQKHMAMHRRNDLVHCSVCDSMVPKSTFDRHLKAHDKDGHLSLVCRLCNRPFKGEEELRRHVPQCHLQESGGESQLRCHACKLDFTDVPQLRDHLASKHGIPVRQHVCLYCPKSFTRLIDKVVHEGIHTRSRPHECSDCCRCFRLRSSLLTHTRIHTGERPYSCQVCGKSFRTKYLVQTHSAIHLTETQFKCPECPKVFKCKERARMHELLHRRPYTCEECGRNFHSVSFMRKHADNHKNGKLVFTCSLCPQMFVRAAYLENHLEMDHGLDSATSISISCRKTFEQMAAGAEANNKSKEPRS